MARRVSAVLLCSFVAATTLAMPANARSRLAADVNAGSLIVEASPTLAPFQHVRFCLRYPDECKSDPAERQRIELTAQTAELLDRVNRDVNAAIVPILKSYGPDLANGWTIAPAEGDCNDYAVTKRHVLRESGLPAKALRLSVVETASGIGHLVLVVATNKGDLVLDNLTQTIRSWQRTGYHWVEIQSVSDARFWYEVKPSGISQSDPGHIRLADR